MTNEEILDQEFAKVGATGMIGKTGKIYQAILSAMDRARNPISESHPYSKEEVEEYDRKNRIARNNLLGQIVNEDGEPVEGAFLIEMFALAISRPDFVKKVNYGITNDNSLVSYENNRLICEWYDRFLHNKPEPSPKGRYFKGEKTLKSMALDWVEENGPCTNTEIRKYMFECSNPGVKWDPVKNRGWYSSYFSETGHPSWFAKGSGKAARFNVPSKNDNRVLSRRSDGRYHVVDLG